MAYLQKLEVIQPNVVEVITNDPKGRPAGFTSEPP
jgi:hypothetical protein